MLRRLLLLFAATLAFASGQPEPEKEALAAPKPEVEKIDATRFRIG